MALSSVELNFACIDILGHRVTLFYVMCLHDVSLLVK